MRSNEDCKRRCPEKAHGGELYYHKMMKQASCIYRKHMHNT